ncbi:alcohol dehydrogenase catalytic domain-containing protein [Streptomyces sp. NBC_00271]|nr:alcohol dehydrogenase catalytic domain-containing protein [Streptomyces sp. NBC_00271]
MTLAVRCMTARTLETAPVEFSEPGPGEVLLVPAYVGICGTDLHIFHGDMDARVAAPAVLGHEMSGRVPSARTVGRRPHERGDGRPSAKSHGRTCGSGRRREPGRTGRRLRRGARWSGARSSSVVPGCRGTTCTSSPPTCWTPTGTPVPTWR